MAHFQKGRLPSAKTFYEHELGRLSRPDRKNRARATCPFHNSKNRDVFSVNLHSGAFHCFSCGESGRDLVDFVQRRYGGGFKEAAMRLGAWDENPTPESVARYEAEATARVRLRALEEEDKAQQRRERLAIRDEVHVAARLHREAAGRLDELHNGASPATPGEEEAAWAVMDLSLADLRDSERRYMLAAGLEWTDEY